MDPGCSDRSPLSITFEDNEDKVPKPFKFLNHLVEHKDFLSIVSVAWQGSNEESTMKDVWKRLKKVKQAMKKLNNTKYIAVREKIKQYRKQLYELKEQIRDPGQYENIVIAEKDIKVQLEKWLGVEESIMK